VPLLTELGEDEDEIRIDMFELVGQKVSVSTHKEDLQYKFNKWHAYVTDQSRRANAEKAYQQHMVDVEGSTAETDTAQTHDSCLELAVLARLLYNKPIRVKRTETQQRVQVSTEEPTKLVILMCLPRNLSYSVQNSVLEK
jgi:hypothetical protein